MADITGMQPAGKVLPIWKGDYDNSIYYEQTDIVLYNNSSYIAKQDTVGNLPPEPADNANDYWQLVAKGIVDADISDATVEFEESQTLQNIQSGEETKTLFGKIKKWFAHLNDIICRDNNDTKVTRIRADEGVQVSNRANDRHIPVYASDFVAGTGGTTGRSLANLSLKDLSDNNYIDVLTNINQITSIGFWKIGSIDSSYAQSIGIRAVDNVGDFYALVSNYNGDGSRFNYGNLQLFSPRLGVNHFEIRVWNGAAVARHAITYDTMLNTTEQISANTESFYAAGALAVKAMMADYNNKINQINSNLVYKAGDIIGNRNTLMWLFGTITTNGREIYTFIPFNKPIVGTCNFNLIDLVIRHNDSYVFESFSTDDIAVVKIDVLNFANSGLYIKLYKDGGVNWYAAMNNDILSVAIKFTVTIS